METNDSNQSHSYWLCPLYSFDCDCESIDLAKGIQIKRIPKQFVEYLEQHYSHMLKTIPSKAEWVASIPNNANINGVSNRVEILSIIFQEHDRVKDLLIDLITALRLYQQGRVVAGLLTSARFQSSEWSIGGDTIWTSVSSLDFFEEEPTYTLRQSDVHKVNDLLQNVRQWREAKILDKINITLERFHSAYHGPIEDRIIDQMIAFESLYLGNEQELTYKLASRVAFLLCKRKDQRIIIFNNIKKAYDYRSRIVHGDDPPSRDELQDIVHNTEDYLRQSIRRFLSLLSKKHSLKHLKQGAKGRLAELDENILSNGTLLSQNSLNKE